MFTINLCLSDFISPLLTYHMFVYSSYMGIWQFSYNMCVFYAICQGFCGLMSIASLAAIAFERYARVTMPQSKWAHMSAKRRLAIIAFLWLYCAMVTTPPLYGLGKYVAAGFLNTCCFDYIDRSLSTRIFILGLFALGLGVPMCVIIYCYVGIGLHVSRTNRNRNISRTVPPSSSSEGTAFCVEQATGLIVGGSVVIEQGAKRRQRVLDKELKIARLTLLIISVFVAAWVPYGTVALLGQYGPIGIVTPWMAMLPSVCAKSSTLYNPILYAYKDVRLQRGIRKYVLQHSSAQNEKSVSASATAAQSVREPIVLTTEI
uniref:G-protein coupled receptors family 1 profile domain-containing protein n=1 Tax=Plectus sambesii TaxID=2011161 RepID=A0A914W1Q9_9BILA